ncbi:MAG: hypothetical protein HY397_04035 [Candidatus Doudnabacteria bacterium]|nr:hypothetical protein [Candidatus Doudnabacteria bacterium]
MESETLRFLLSLDPGEMIKVRRDPQSPWFFARVHTVARCGRQDQPQEQEILFLNAGGNDFSRHFEQTTQEQRLVLAFAGPLAPSQVPCLIEAATLSERPTLQATRLSPKEMEMASGLHYEIPAIEAWLFDRDTL